MRTLTARVCASFWLWGLVPLTSLAAPVFFGPTPHSGHGGTPAGFFCNECPSFVEDFEDALPSAFEFDFGTFDRGRRVGPDFVSGGSATVDSVDGDGSGILDGDGSDGWAWYAEESRSLVITFDAPVTSAGLVLTDGPPVDIASITFEARDADFNWIPLSVANFLDDSNAGETPEDHFLGARDPAGIRALRITLDTAGAGFEIDHLQWQDCATCPIPEPASLGLALLGLASLLAIRRRS